MAVGVPNPHYPMPHYPYQPPSVEIRCFRCSKLLGTYTPSDGQPPQGYSWLCVPCRKGPRRQGGYPRDFLDRPTCPCHPPEDTPTLEAIWASPGIWSTTWQREPSITIPESGLTISG